MNYEGAQKAEINLGSNLLIDPLIDVVALF